MRFSHRLSVLVSYLALQAIKSMTCTGYFTRRYLAAHFRYRATNRDLQGRDIECGHVILSATLVIVVDNILPHVIVRARILYVSFSSSVVDDEYQHENWNIDKIIHIIKVKCAQNSSFYQSNTSLLIQGVQASAKCVTKSSAEISFTMLQCTKQVSVLSVETFFFFNESLLKKRF